MINISSPTEEKAEECRKQRDWKGIRAIEKEGVHYCFIPGEKPDCANEESAVLEVEYHSSTHGNINTPSVVRERHYVCGLRMRLEGGQNG